MWINESGSDNQARRINACRRIDIIFLSVADIDDLVVLDPYVYRLERIARHPTENQSILNQDMHVDCRFSILCALLTGRQQERCRCKYGHQPVSIESHTAALLPMNKP